MHLATIAGSLLRRASRSSRCTGPKADAPSGTALHTAQLLARARGAPFVHRPTANVHPGRRARAGTVEGIGIHSVRLPGLVAHQEVIFGGLGQTLTLRHDTTSNESYVPGGPAGHPARPAVARADLRPGGAAGSGVEPPITASGPADGTKAGQTMGARETDFGRLITAMVTPFGKDGAVDYAQAGRLARTLWRTAADSIVVSGTTGESPTLSTEEKLRLFRTVQGGRRRAGQGRRRDVQLQHPGEHRADPRGGGQLDGVLMVVPYYNNPPQEGLYRHFRTIAEQHRACPASSTTSPAARCATWRRRPPCAWPGTCPTSWASRRPSTTWIRWRT